MIHKRRAVESMWAEGAELSIEDRLDRLFATAIQVKVELKRRTKWVIAAIVVMLVFISSIGAGVWRLHTLADQNHNNSEVTRQNSVDLKAASADIKQALGILNSATGPEAQDRQREVLAAAIDDIRRSINCVGFYTLGKRPPACVSTDARMDEIDAGGDPFHR